MILIGIAGGARHGKDSTGDHICRRMARSNWTVRRISFATKIKEIVSDVFLVDMDFIEKWKVRADVPPGFDIPMRDALIKIGDGFRQIKSSVWIDIAVSRLDQDQDDVGTLPDVRYCNELQTIKSHGGITVLVYRPSHENDIQNESEAQMRRIVTCLLAREFPEGPINMSDMNPYKPHGFLGFEPPAGIDLIDVFIKNDGTLEELQAKIDKWVLPLIDAKLAAG